MTWSPAYTPTFRKDYKNLSRQNQERVDDAITDILLTDDPKKVGQAEARQMARGIRIRRRSRHQGPLFGRTTDSLRALPAMWSPSNLLIPFKLATIAQHVQIQELTFPVLFAALENPGTYPLYVFFDSSDTVDSFSLLASLYNGTYVSSPPSNPALDIQALLKQAEADANNPSEYSSVLQHIQSVAVKDQYEAFLYDLSDNIVSVKSTVATGWVPMYGDVPSLAPDYYAMSPA